MSARSRDKQFMLRLTDEERQKLEEIAKSKCFQNASDYVRYMTIGEGHRISDGIEEILKEIKKDK